MSLAWSIVALGSALFGIYHLINEAPLAVQTRDAVWFFGASMLARWWDDR